MPLELAFRAQLVLADHREVYDYWVGLAVAGRLPSRAAIDPARLKRRLPLGSLIDVSAEPRRYRMRLMGTGLREAYDEDLTGRYIDELPLGSQRDYWHAALNRVVAGREPAQGYSALSWKGKSHLVQAWLRLPLSSDGERVDMIFGYDRFIRAASTQEALHLAAAAGS